MHAHFCDLYYRISYMTSHMMTSLLNRLFLLAEGKPCPCKLSKRNERHWSQRKGKSSSRCRSISLRPSVIHPQHVTAACFSVISDMPRNFPTGSLLSSLQEHAVWHEKHILENSQFLPGFLWTSLVGAKRMWYWVYPGKEFESIIASWYKESCSFVPEITQARWTYWLDY